MVALQVGTVYACVNIISGAFAALPLHVYEHVQKKGDYVGKRRALTHTLWDLLHNEPNDEMTTFTWLKAMMVHGLLWGNSYTEIQRDASNQIVALWPRNPARTRPVRTLSPFEMEGTVYPVGTMVYETTENVMDNDYSAVAENKDNHIGKVRIVLAEDMLHVPGLSLDGRLGQSTVYLARQAVGLSLATEKYGAKFFGNGARPSGVLTVPNKLGDIALENLRRSWAEAHGGENQFKTAVLEQGISFTKIASTPNEGQMLETRQYQRAEICAIFNVPLHMVAASEKAGKSNVEQSSIEFVLYCLNPWVTSWEQELERKLFPSIGRSANKFFPKFDTRKLLYPDAAARSTFYSSGRQWGYLNKNDIRELEDLNLDETGAGDLYWAPVNMQSDVAMIKGGVADGSRQLPPAPPTPTEPLPAKRPPVKKKAKQNRAYPAGDAPLYIMRHGETEANKEDIYRGWGDYLLNEDGLKHAAQAAEFLRDLGIKRIVTSELPRHQQTARMVTDTLGLVPISLDNGFRSLNVGIYTGKLRDTYKDEVEWYLMHSDVKIPGGESLDEFADRNEVAFDKVRSENELAGPTLVICSRSNIAELYPGPRHATAEMAAPGGVYRLDGMNNLEQIFGTKVVDTLAGT